MSDSSLAAAGGDPAHYLAFSTIQDGTHSGGSEFNVPTTLPATAGGTSQGFFNYIQVLLHLELLVHMYRFITPVVWTHL